MIPAQMAAYVAGGEVNWVLEFTGNGTTIRQVRAAGYGAGRQVVRFYTAFIRLNWRFIMFESLADHIKEDEKQTTTQIVVRWAAIAVIAVGLFGGLYFAVRMMG